jgi:osmotically-inducible protein OsmY
MPWNDPRAGGVNPLVPANKEYKMKNRMNNTLLGTIVIFGATLAAAGGAIAATPDDGMLARQVEQAVRDAQLRYAEVKAVVTDGRVDLQGWVNAPNDVLLAMKQAAAVPGAKSVVSSLRTWSSTERYSY